MKKIELVFSKCCIESQSAISLLNELKALNLIKHYDLIEFSFDEALVKKLNIIFTPAFIIDNKLIFTGTPDKDSLLKELE